MKNKDMDMCTFTYTQFHSDMIYIYMNIYT